MSVLGTVVTRSFLGWALVLVVCVAHLQAGTESNVAVSDGASSMQT